MASTMDKVITTGTSGGNPFRNVTQTNVGHGGEGKKLVNSTVVTTISGRTVHKPIKK